MRLSTRDMGWATKAGFAIDRALAILAPVWARNRVAARAQHYLLDRAVSSGVPDRTSAVRSPSKLGPIAKGRKELVPTRAQARELYMKNPYGRGVINSMVANLIGTGIRPQARVMKPKKGQPDDVFNDAAEEEWKWYSEACDPSGREHYYEQQKQMQTEMLVAGETLLALSVPKDKRRIPLATEVITSERLASDLDEERKDGSRIVQGVEFDSSGARVAYWIFKNHPSDSILLVDKPQRVEADRICHLFDPLEPGQVRGLTRFMTCAGALEALMQLMDFQLTRARIASAFALMITDDGTGVRLVKTGNTADDTDEDDNDIANIEGGILLRGRPGQGLASTGPGIQDTQLEAFVTIILRMIARAMDVAYELASLDFSKVTYLSARQGENQSRRHWEPQQQFMNRIANRRVWQSFVDAAAIVGRLRIGDPKDRFYASDWIPDGWDWIDPVKDAQAETALIQAGLASPLEIIAKHGRDPFKVLEDIEMYKAWAEEKGLELTIFGSKPQPAAAPGSAPESAPEEEKKPGQEDAQKETDGKEDKAQAA